MSWVVPIIGAYLLGSVPFAYILARAHGKDLRTIGSGNIGATNLARALGRGWGYVCFALDMLKGFVPMVLTKVFLLPLWQGRGIGQGQVLLFWLMVGAAAVVGHVFPVYLGFRGGKGVATSFGVAIGLWPYYTLCAVLALLIWIVVLSRWRYVSLASIVAASSFPLLLLLAIALLPDWDLKVLWPLVVLAGLIAGAVVILHRTNIKWILSGTEHRVLEGRR